MPAAVTTMPAAAMLATMTMAFTTEVAIHAVTTLAKRHHHVVILITTW